MNKMNLKDIQKVIGTPKENRDVLVKSLLLDLRLKCKACKTIYDTGKSMMGLNIKGYSDASNPNILFCLFECSCGHGGGHEFAPNPFMKVAWTSKTNVIAKPHRTWGESINE